MCWPDACPMRLLPGWASTRVSSPWPQLGSARRSPGLKTQRPAGRLTPTRSVRCFARVASSCAVLARAVRLGSYSRDESHPGAHPVLRAKSPPWRSVYLVFCGFPLGSRSPRGTPATGADPVRHSLVSESLDAAPVSTLPRAREDQTCETALPVGAAGVCGCPVVTVGVR